MKTQITRRLHDLHAAEHAVLASVHRQPRTAGDHLHRVVRIIADMPGTHLGWLHDSGRYQ
ncbi:hypothetical protein [Streptomyces sp. NPDC018610]|uniref:hypothetical protein n=1 Tax=Streptomyces sp. NPDC018610 TaxID=3365049 RepID=UPI0037907F57